MQVPFFSLKEQTADLRQEAMQALANVVDSQGFANGPPVAAFEKQFAHYLGVTDSVCVNTGTTSLQAALLCVGVGPGDEVITTPMTWISTAWAISYVGATPVFADVDATTCCIDPKQIETKITKKTKAILPVHLYGHPAELDPIVDLAKSHRLALVEDCAQSIGAKYKGKHTGTFSQIAATSFYPGKNLGAFGEGGAIMTNDPVFAARVRRLRDHAQDGRHNHVEIGYNWRLDGFQGAILSLKLPHLDNWNARRRQIAARYRAGLAGVAGLRLLPEHAWAEPTWHIFPAFYARRDELRSKLEQFGVGTGVHYPRGVHLQPAYAHLGYKTGAFPVAERIGATQLSLPMYPELRDEQVDYAIEQIRAAASELPV